MGIISRLLFIFVLALCVSIVQSSSPLNEADELCNRGDNLYVAGHYQEALKCLREALSIYKTIDRTEKEQAGCYGSIAEALRTLGRLKGSIANREKEIELLEEIAASDGIVAVRYTKLGRVLMDVGKYRKSMEMQERALELLEGVEGKDRRRAHCYEAMAEVLRRLGSYEESMAKRKTARELYERLSDEDCYEANMFIMFDISEIPPEYQICSATMHLYYYMWHDNDPVGRNLNLYRVAGDWDEETITYKTEPPTAPEIVAHSTVPSDTGTWMTWDVTGDVQAYVNGQIDNHGWKIMDWDFWGEYYIPQTKFYSREYPDSEYIPYLEVEVSGSEDPVSTFRTDTEIFFSTDDAHTSQPDSNGNSGSDVNLCLRNRYGAVGVMSERAQCYMDIGLTLRELGRYEDGMASYEKALGLYERIRGSDKDAAGCWITIGDILWILGKHEECIAKQEMALKTCEMMAEMKKEQADCYFYIGNALRSLGRYEESTMAYEKALEFYEKVEGTGCRQASCHQSIGITYEHLGRYEECMAGHGRALEAYAEIEGTEREQGECYWNIGKALLNAGRLEESITNYEKALECYGKMEGTEREQSECFLSLARAHRCQSGESGFEQVARSLGRAIVLAERCREKAYGMEARMGLFKRVSSIYSEVVSFLVECSEGDWSPQDSLFDEWSSSPEAGTSSLEIALHFSEAGKARTLLESISQRIPQVRDSSSIRLLSRDSVLLSEIGALHAQRMALVNPADERRALIQEKIREKETKRDEIEYELKSTLIGRYRVPHFERAHKIQEKIEKYVAVLEYTVGENEIVVVALTRAEIGGWRIPVKRDLPDTLQENISECDKKMAEMFEEDASSIGLVGLVSLYRNWMENLSPDRWERRIDRNTHIEVGRHLCNLLLPEETREMLEKNGIKKLIIVPDHVLHLLPFAALIMGTKTVESTEDYADCRFLIEDYSVSRASSMALLDVTRKQRAERMDREKKGVIAFGNAVFDEEDERLERQSSLLEEVETEQGSFAWNHYAETRMGLGKLRETEGEVKRIAYLFPEMKIYRELPPGGALPEGNSCVLLGLAASGEALKMIPLKDYQYVHFATHGFADEENPWLSCIVLSGHWDGADYRPFFLKAMDVFGLELDADLVTLSGCETGLGKCVSGEGMVGLVTGFFYSGTSSVVASLWPVSSEETTELMESFYRQLANGEGKAEALHAAQLGMIDRGVADPTFWAPFVLHGEWK